MIGWRLLAGMGILMVAIDAAAGAGPEPLAHTSTAFDLVVHAPYAETTQLFGPEGERAWAGKEWDPHFIYPKEAADIEGAVFTIDHGSTKAVWVNTAFDTERGHYQYVYFLPGIMVTKIDVRFVRRSAQETGVRVEYARTAITPDGNAHVKKMTEHDQIADKEWQEAIDAFLASRATPVKH